MERKHLVLSWGKRVINQSGRSRKLRGVYLAPRSGQITHALVQSRPFRHPTPMTLDNATEEANGVLVLPEQQQQGTATPSRGSVRFTAKTSVHCSDGASVSLQGLILDRGRRAMEYVLVGNQRNAHAVHHSQVQKFASGSPSITLGYPALETLPVFRPDDEAQRNALAALEDADPTGDTFRAVQLDVVDGTAYMSGSVRLPVQRALAEETVAKAKGVLGVDSSIVADWDLCIAIAEALAQEGLTRQGLVMVKSSLGRVTLSGHLPAQELIDTAVAVAAKVAGVHSIEHSIRVQAHPVGGPAKEPAPSTEAALQEVEEVTKGEE